MVKSVEPPFHSDISSDSSKFSSGIAWVSESEYTDGSIGSRSEIEVGGGASRSSKWIPEWKVPHSEHRTEPFGSKHPQTGHAESLMSIPSGS